MLRFIVYGFTFLAMSSLIGAADKEPKSAPAPKNSDEVRALLVKRINFQGLEDQRTKLSEGLEQLTARYTVLYDVDEEAFKAAGIANVTNLEIANPYPIFGNQDMTLFTVLRSIVHRIPSTSPATFAVQGNKVLISTRAGLLKKGIRPEPLPDAKSSKQAKELKTFLDRPVAIPAGVKSPKRFWDIFDTQKKLVVYNIAAFKRETSVDAMEEIVMLTADANKTPMGKLLEKELGRVKVLSGITYIIRHDHIEITTKRALKEEEGAEKP